ncbi:MAG: replicative DNA helicase [Chthoniobacter sp.]|nr:replicative DNA helicase [Chthoniobacter sp.]
MSRANLKDTKYLPEIHRLLPQAADAERGVISSFLIDPRVVGGMCAEQGIREEHFHLPAHARIFGTLMVMWDGNKPIDIVTVTQWLRDRNELDQAGGAALVTELFTFLPTATNAEYYMGVLVEKFTLRSMISVCTEYASRCYEEQDDVPALLDGAEAAMCAIAGARYSRGMVSTKDLTMEAIAGIERMYEARGAVSGLTTGFKELDQMTDGLHPAEMIVIAARPSMGKTALAMNIAEHIALDLQKPVAVFSLEMSAGQLMQRLLCSRARVDFTGVRRGFLAEADFPKLTKAAEVIAAANSRLFIDDTPALPVLELRAKARRMKSQHNIQAIFIDYLQLLRSLGKRAQENRQIEISEISQGLKALAKELELPVVMLAQLNRNPENREGGRPRLSDLRESGSIEQDADVVGLLVREEYYAVGEEAKAAVAGKATLDIAKNRNGPVGDVALTFLKEFTRFETRAREAEE